MQTARTRFERDVALEGCFNFRDLGGYTTLDNRWVLPHRLYRADGPHALTASDVVGLRGLGLATVIDLRTPQEVRERGCYVEHLGDVIEYHLPLIDVLPDADELPGWIDPSVVARQYRDMLDRGQDAIVETLAILSDPSAYPTVFHCSAGKDRTGILAAVLLGVLGVPDDTIVADYVLSAAAMHRLVDFYKAAVPDAGDLLARLAPAMVSAHPQTMVAFLADLRRDYGSFDGYVEAIGVNSAPRYIRDALLT